MTQLTVPSLVGDLGGIPMAKPWFGAEEVEAVVEVVRSGWVSQGAVVARFEQAMADMIGVPHAVAVSNCTAALHLGMVGHGIKAGDEVIVPSLSFVATANVVRYVGATPVFAEVDPVTHNVTADTVAERITPRTTAVIAVDQCGVPADMNPIAALCARHSLALVEDAACAIGSRYASRPVGATSDFAAFSFHPRKILVTGEGGLITTGSSQVAQRMRRLRQHGMSASSFERHSSAAALVETYDETGFNFRMTDMQAALGLVQATKVSAMVKQRRLLAAAYQERLASLSGAVTVRDPDYGSSNYQSFWLLLPDDFAMSRNDLLAWLKQRGINGRRGVTAAHLEPAFADLAATDLPITKHIAERSVLLPLYHEMSVTDVERVCDAILLASTETSRSLERNL